MTRYGKTMMEALSEVREGYSPKQIKMAIGIASDKRYAGGNMSGAVTAIEKIKKGLSDHKQVAAVLKRQNEDTEPQESVQEVSEMPQESEESIEEAINFDAASKSLEDYAKKSGGIDKTDFQKVAAYVRVIGKNSSKSVQDKAFMLMKKFVSDMDTDPRDGVIQILKKHGMYKNGRMMQEAKSSTGYDLYHKTFSGAMQHSYAFAKKKFGMEIDPEEIDDKVATGPAKPKTGKTNTYRLKAKGSKKGIQVQVYNTGKSYELNMYKEEVELDEAKATGKQVKALNALMLKALGIKKMPAKHDYTSTIADNGDFVVSGGQGQVSGRIKKGAFVDPMKEELDEGMKMNDPKLLKVFDKLKKGSTVKIKHDSTLEKGKDFIEYIVKSKNMVNKGRVEKITMARKDSPTSAKRYLYKRDEKVTMAMGDMAVSPVDIKEDFEPHMMYDPKTGKGYKANTMDDHLKMKKMGYTHDKPEEEVSENKKADLAKKLAKAAASSKKGKEKVTLSKFPWKKEEAEEPNKPDSAKEVEKGRDDKKKTRIAQLQLQIAKAQETINKMNAQEK